MAPGIQTENGSKPDESISYDINLPYKAIKADVAQARTEFPQYLPSWDDKGFHEENDEFKYYDPALRADKDMPHLLKAGMTMTDITPKMSTIIRGLKLDELDDVAKDELALLISLRKLIVFRDQLDFLGKGPGIQQDFMAYFGKPNIQPVIGSVKGHPGFHIIHRDDNQAEIEAFFRKKPTFCLWHQDVSYEHPPPGYIMLGILACPEVGGDNVFADTCEAYK